MMSWLRGWPLLAVISIGCGARTLDPGSDASGIGGGDPVSGGGGGTAGNLGTDGGAAAGGQDVRDARPADVARMPSCADGFLDTALAETCDDGNTRRNDGCSALCQVECSWSCGVCGAANGPCVATPSCGDGRLDQGEACDDGNLGSGDGCPRDCKPIEIGWRCPAPGRRCIPICGDGRIVGRETCDDGNTTAGDGCSDICVADDSGDRCGDGIIAGAEECDLGAQYNADNWFYDGCTTQCRLGPWCGDGIVNGLEECDAGPSANTQGYGSKDGCAPGCRFPHFCGDAIVDTDVGEQCDFGLANGAPYNGTLSYYCTVDCKMILI